MNVLILSCGTRCKLVSFFRESGLYENVIVTDCNEEAPALYMADRFYIVPRFRSPEYLGHILDICKNEKIHLLIVLQEEELLIISKEKKAFEELGVFVALSDHDKVSLCKDKYLLNQYLNDHGIRAVKTYLANDFLNQDNLEFPVVVKPRYGAGSVDTMVVKKEALLRAIVENSEEEMIVQPLISGTEFGVDSYVDSISKKVTAMFCKKKLRMRAGETEKSISVISDEIKSLVKKAIETIGLIGPVDCDVFEWNGDYYILEINPRFGGGYPHAHLCGISFPKYLANNVDNIENKEFEDTYQAGVMALKYTDLIIREV